MTCPLLLDDFKDPFDYAYKTLHLVIVKGKSAVSVMKTKKAELYTTK